MIGSVYCGNPVSGLLFGDLYNKSFEFSVLAQISELEGTTSGLEEATGSHSGLQVDHGDWMSCQEFLSWALELNILVVWEWIGCTSKKKKK